MSNSKTVSVVAAFTIADAVKAHCNAGVTEIVTHKSAAEAAANAIKAASTDRLTIMAGIWSQLPGMTGDKFDSEVRQLMFDTYKGAYVNFDAAEAKALNVIKNRLSIEKVAIIALSNGSHLGKSLAPLAGETLQPFVKRVNFLIQAKSDTVPALYTPKSGAKAKEPKLDTDTGKVVSVQTSVTKAADKLLSRDAALKVICNGDAADMQMLDWLTSNAMVSMRGLYAALNPIKSK